MSLEQRLEVLEDIIFLMFHQKPSNCPVTPLQPKVRRRLFSLTPKQPSYNGERIVLGEEGWYTEEKEMTHESIHEQSTVLWENGGRKTPPQASPGLGFNKPEILEGTFCASKSCFK